MSFLQFDEGIALSLADILSSLSYALDLTSGQPMGHSQRSCLIAMRIAKEIQIPEELQDVLYYAVLMKDLGCSSNAARMASIFGSDDIGAKRMSKITDWSNVIEATRYVAANTLPKGSLLARARKMMQVAANQHEISDGVMETRCDRGAMIAQRIGLGPDAADCIRGLDEHWNGHGGPNHLKGDKIPILARLACISQTLEVFLTTFDLETAYEMINRRSGKWFDPALVLACESFHNDHDFWRQVREETREALLNLEVRASIEHASEERVDSICQAFADVVDAKSPFTAEHSSRVCTYSVAIARNLGFTGKQLTELRRAALLHDVGKLAVSNSILDKNGKPTDEEWAAIRKHPYYTQQVLGKIAGFERISEIAAAHHERLDGKGYHQNVPGEKLDLDMRIITTADVFDALSATRPYRGALPLEQVYSIMERDIDTAFDPLCISAVKDCYPSGSTDLSLIASRLAA